MFTNLKIDPKTRRPVALSTFHPVNGKWVHIGQIYNEDGIVYYVDNELVPPETIPEPNDLMKEIKIKMEEYDKQQQNKQDEQPTVESSVILSQGEKERLAKEQEEPMEEPKEEVKDDEKIFIDEKEE